MTSQNTIPKDLTTHTSLGGLNDMSFTTHTELNYTNLSNSMHASIIDDALSRSKRDRDTDVKSKFTPSQLRQVLRPSLSQNVNVNTQFIARDVIDIARTSARLLIKSDMGTGKTYAIADVIRGDTTNLVTLVVTHLTTLVAGNMHRIDALLGGSKRLAHYSESSDDDITDAQVVFTTLHSLPKVLANLGVDRIGRVMFDESESVSQMLTSPIIDKQRSTVAAALGELAESGCQLMMMDAHLGDATYAMCNSYLGGGQWAQLTNTYQRWSGSQATWVLDPMTRFGGNAEKAGIESVAVLLKAGHKPFVTTTSKEQANRIYNTLAKLGVLAGLRVLQAYTMLGADSDELTACKGDHDKFNDYDLVIASPTVGTGISIEPRKGVPNFTEVVAFLAKSSNSPDAYSAMQMPFRVRQTATNRLILVACNMEPQTTRVHEAFMAARDLGVTLDGYNALATRYPGATNDAHVKAAFFGTYAVFDNALRVRDADLWDTYYSTIQAEFEAKGIRFGDALEAAPTAELIEADSAARAAAREAAVQALFDAPIVGEEEARKIDQRLKRGDVVSAGEHLASRKYKLLRDYATDANSGTTLPELAELMKADEKGLIGGVRAIANARLSKAEINKLQKAWMTEPKFALDATSKSALRLQDEWRMAKLLCAIAGVSFTDDAYTYTPRVITADALTKREGAYRANHADVSSLMKLLPAWNATHQDARISPKAVEQDPVKVVAKLLKNFLKLKLRVKNKGESITLAPTQPTIDLLNYHHTKDQVGMAKLVTAVAEWEESIKQPEPTEACDEWGIQLAKPESDTPAPQLDAITQLGRAWEAAGQPLPWMEILAMFEGELPGIECSKYTTAELAETIKTLADWRS